MTPHLPCFDPVRTRSVSQPEGGEGEGWRRVAANCRRSSDSIDCILLEITERNEEEEEDQSSNGT